MGLQMAQAVHAAFTFADEHPEIAHVWHRDSQFVVVVSVPDEAALLTLALDAGARDIPTSLWREPDQHGEATAIALAPVPAAMKLCSSLPLAGRVPV